MEITRVGSWVLGAALSLLVASPTMAEALPRFELPNWDDGPVSTASLAGNVPRVLRDYEVNSVPILVFIGRDGLVRHVVHHYILPEEFRAHVKEIVARD